MYSNRVAGKVRWICKVTSHSFQRWTMLVFSEQKAKGRKKSYHFQVTTMNSSSALVVLNKSLVERRSKRRWIELLSSPDQRNRLWRKLPMTPAIWKHIRSFKAIDSTATSTSLFIHIASIQRQSSSLSHNSAYLSQNNIEETRNTVCASNHQWKRWIFRCTLKIMMLSKLR